jgi:hypothetical protein
LLGEARDDELGHPIDVVEPIQGLHLFMVLPVTLVLWQQLDRNAPILAER